MSGWNETAFQSKMSKGRNNSLPSFYRWGLGRLNNLLLAVCPENSQAGFESSSNSAALYIVQAANFGRRVI